MLFANIIVDVNISILPSNNAKVSFSPKNKIPKNILTIGSKVPSIAEDETPIISTALRSKIIDIMVEIIDIPRQHPITSKFKFKIIDLLNTPYKTRPIVDPKQRYIVTTLLSKHLIDFKLSAIKVVPYVTPESKAKKIPKILMELLLNATNEYVPRIAIIKDIIFLEFILFLNNRNSIIQTTTGYIKCKVVARPAPK
ncbi:hypothetical protein rsdtw13_36720 [Clostridium sp. TW13]|uniref:Uncharacterized protein n=1 Tax=Inconstantimicrobium mannanitabidum TaxID=1604901 RepID=A0ACB5RH36_9CLOT|nr:hypothetical protein rsdtw13_36720 [Clostridium sp. TW13]